MPIVDERTLELMRRLKSAMDYGQLYAHVRGQEGGKTDSEVRGEMKTMLLPSTALIVGSLGTRFYMLHGHKPEDERRLMLHPGRANELLHAKGIDLISTQDIIFKGAKKGPIQIPIRPEGTPKSILPYLVLPFTRETLHGATIFTRETGIWGLGVTDELFRGYKEHWAGSQKIHFASLQVLLALLIHPTSFRILYGRPNDEPTPKESKRLRRAAMLFILNPGAGLKGSLRILAGNAERIDKASAEFRIASRDMGMFSNANCEGELARMSQAISKTRESIGGPPSYNELLRAVPNQASLMKSSLMKFADSAFGIPEEKAGRRFDRFIELMRHY